MLNVIKLRDKMKEKNTNIKSLAGKMSINPATFYRKMKNNSFEIAEADIIVRELNLTQDEANSIFFAQ